MATKSLSRFLEDIYMKCTFSIQSDEESDIHDAVTEMVKNAMEKLSDVDIRCKMSQVLPTGGYFEETKIGNPDEFDFMVECFILSQPSELTFEPGCTGCVKMKPNSPEKWSEFCDNGYLVYNNPDNIVTDGILSIKKNINMRLENYIDEIEHEIVKPTGKLILCGFGHMTFALWWESFLPETHKSSPNFGDISVDVMPAIVCPKELITMSNASFPEHLLEEAVESGVYVVPKKCHIFSPHLCCQLSFSRVELSLVRKLSEHHTKCYKILKYISGELSCLFIDSYALKTAMLHHHYNEKCSETENVSACVTSVLTYLKTCSEHGFLPALFVPEKNIWGYSNVNDKEDTSEIRYQHQADLLGLLLDIVDHIARIDDAHYSFEESLSILEKMTENLSRYSQGKIKIPKVVKLTKGYMSKREKQNRQSPYKRENQEGNARQSGRKSLCKII